MLFSVVIPIYNIGNDLRKCLESIRTQTFTDFEAIMVDDGSSDVSPAICDEYAGMDARFKVIHKPNGGLTSARKTGFSLTSGDYIVSIDGDDYVDETYLEQVAKLVEEYAPDVITCDYKRVDPDGCARYERGILEPGVYTEAGLDELRAALIVDLTRRAPNAGSVPYSIWSKIVKRDVYAKCQCRVPDHIMYGEDMLLSCFILSEAGSVYVSDICSYNYVMSGVSMSLHFDMDKFARYNDTVMELKKLVSEEKVHAFAMFILAGLLISLGKQEKTFGGFREKALSTFPNTELWESALRYPVRNVYFIRLFQYWFVKKKCWGPLYVASKIFRRKL